ncbi:MAG: efflux RND transporter periplasmic adaptor subunit [Planctomycetes bacterium]|nr:efflux RND transporter periplasmic adaptor subunit [Planctomycetota bacterium]
MKIGSSLCVGLLAALLLSACHKPEEQVHHEAHKIVATCPQSQSVTITQQYVCQIHSQRHIKVRALEMGYLEAIPIKEGQVVKAGDVLFNVIPTLYKARFAAETAEADLARLEFNNTRRLWKDNVVSEQAVKLIQAKLTKAEARAQLAGAELDFASVKAPFDGIVDRLYHQHGSLVQEGDVLTTLSDNRVMWVYFNVPEKRYLEYKANLAHKQDSLQIELVLASGEKFPYVGKIGAIEADFNNQTGNISFRADFPNPDGLLRHGQTGTILIHQVVDNAVVIPQRATFEVLDKQYVYVVDEEAVAHQREIRVEHVIEDLYVIKKGVSVEDRIVLEGIREVRDGDSVEYENQEPADVVAHLKYHAE